MAGEDNRRLGGSCRGSAAGGTGFKGRGFLPLSRVSLFLPVEAARCLALCFCFAGFNGGFVAAEWRMIRGRGMQTQQPGVRLFSSACVLQVSVRRRLPEQRGVCVCVFHGH